MGLNEGKQMTYERDGKHLKARVYVDITTYEALRRDAERYRWLRDGSNWPAVFASSDAPEPLRGDELDAAIDAAMKA